MDTFDVAVIGLGVMGSAAVWSMSKRNMRVIGFDQFPTLHTYGSSHGKTRVIRKAYFEDPAYVPLLRKSYELWNELAAGAGRPILNLCGVLFVGDAESDLIEGTFQAAKIHNLPIQKLSAEALRNRYPQFSPLPNEIGIFEDEAGFIYAENSIQSMNKLSLELGAQLVHQEVIEIDFDLKPKRIRTREGKFLADQVILCQGSWSQDFLAELGVNLTVTRQLVGWFETSSEPQFNLDHLPVYGVDRGEKFIYGIPSGEGPDLNGLKVACHNRGPEINPSVETAPVTETDLTELARDAQIAFPGFNSKICDVTVCRYSNSQDGHFIIDHHPHHDGVHFAAGFSGHGFKFAPAVGEVLADFVEFGHSKLPADFLNLSRFYR